MPDALQITGIHLTPLAPEQITGPMAESGQGWYTLEIVVENTGAVPLFVVSSVRRLAYDEGRRALLVELNEHRFRDARYAGLPFPPHYEEVAAGSEATITDRLSSIVTFMLASADGPPGPRFVRVPEDVDIIDARIAADGTRPPESVNLASHEALPDPSQWGTIVQRSVRIAK